MKKDTTHSALLGLTQVQMSMLLKVHPSQWSMYESGQRDLPLKPSQILAEMLSYLQLEDKGLKVQQYRNKEEDLLACGLRGHKGCDLAMGSTRRLDQRQRQLGHDFVFLV